jgi:hypothetical protein
MDYKKLYLEYKQKYLMSQKYLMGGGFPERTVADMQESRRNTNFNKNIKELINYLHEASFEDLNNYTIIKEANGYTKGMVWDSQTNHPRKVEIKYSYINKKTLEDLGKCDTFFNNLKYDFDIYQKKMFILSFDVD